MITPAYAPTATERVLPRMALDFTTASLDPRVTVARALNTATRINSSGVVEIVNADIPRFDYDPVTLLCKGLLIEETRANSALQSDLLITPTWSGLRLDRTDNGNYARLTVNTTSVNGAYWTYLGASRAAGTYTFSVNISKTSTNKSVLRMVNTSNSASFATVGFDPTTGVATATSVAVDFSSASVAVVNMGSDWRVSLTATTTGTITFQPRIFVSDASASISTTLGANIDARYAQFETGAFATSYIPTTTTSLTRNADVVSMTGTNFSDWYNASEGTFVTGYRVNNLVTPSVKPVFAAYDGTFNSNRVYLNAGVSGQTNLLVNSGGSAQASILGAFVTANTLVKTASKYKVNDFALATNGITPATDTSGLVPVGSDRLDIGVYQPASVYLNGHMAFINYYPLGLTTNEVRAFSK